MTPKEKATDLFEQFYNLTPNEAFFNEPLALTEYYSATLLAKKCALITVEEILKSKQTALTLIEVENSQTFTDYWNKVKNEILKQKTFKNGNENNI